MEGKFDGRSIPTEYDMVSGSVIGNVMFLKQRYPNDKIMHEKLRHLTDYVLRLGYLMGTDRESALRFMKDFKKGRYG